MPEVDRLAAREAAFGGELPLAGLERLRALLSRADDTVDVHLKFRQLANVCVILDVRCAARLELLCQRCLEPVAHAVDFDVSYGLLETEADGFGLPADIEAFVIDGERFNPARLVEDELIVSLPLVSRHASRAECGGLARELDRISKEANPETDRTMGQPEGGPRSSVASANQ